MVTIRVTTIDGVGAFTLDSTPSGETYDVLRQLFDAIVEVRPGDDGSEFRVRGSDFGPRAWTSFRSEERRVGKECRL